MSRQTVGMDLGSGELIGLIACETMEECDLVAIDGVGSVMGRHHSDHCVRNVFE